MNSGRLGRSTLRFRHPLTKAILRREAAVWLNSVRVETSQGDTAPERPDGLIGRTPDPEGDRQALAVLSDPDHRETRRLARRLHIDDDWRDSSLHDLMPGLDLVESPLSDRLGTRAANCLRRSETSDWTALANMTPDRVHRLPNVGVKTVEQILLMALSEWASTYLCMARRGENGEGSGVSETIDAIESRPRSGTEDAQLGGAPVEPRDDGPSSNGSSPLARLLERVPGHGDRGELLALANPKDTAARQLARQIHTDELWRDASLNKLMPGLGLIESPAFLDHLGVRSANCLGRAGAKTLDSLARMTPAEILELPTIGPQALEEILAAVASEWALAYLRHEEGKSGSPESGAFRQGGVAEHLRTIDLWASVAHGTNGSVEAILATAGSKERLPESVEHALRKLNECGVLTEQDATPPLAQAFEKLEGTPGFLTFKRRRLDAGIPPSFADLATEQGVSSERVRDTDAKIRSVLSKRMREGEWPLRVAVDEMRRHIGSVARPAELSETFAVLDPDGKTLPEHRRHRRALLLWLGGYRQTEEWVLGPDIECLTKVILSGLADSGSASLDRAERHLALLGVRKELQMPWILSQYGFRIIDGELVGTAAG